MPNQRQRRARRVVKGMAAEDPAPQSKRFSVKNTTNTTLGMEGGETDEEVRAAPVTYRLLGHTLELRRMTLAHCSSNEGLPSLKEKGSYTNLHAHCWCSPIGTWVLLLYSLAEM